MDDQFDRKLASTYYVETTLVDVLEDVAKDVTNDRIRRGFHDHREETMEHVGRLEDVFQARGDQPDGRASPVFDGVIEEREQMLAEISDDHLRDPYYLGAGMMIEQIELNHYAVLLMLASESGAGTDVLVPLERNMLSEQTTLRQLQGLSGGSMLKETLGELLG